MKKKIIISIIIFLLIFILFFYLKSQKKNIKTKTIEPEISSDIVYGSNIIEDVYHSSNDIKGNKYVIKASTGEIDYNNSNIIFLTNVSGFIKLKNSSAI